MKMFDFSNIFRQKTIFLLYSKNIKKIIITMDNDPFSLLENGYKKLNLFDFLLNNNSLEEI
ncbi:MAG: hypothetical protein KH380_01740 [Coprobacillus sp.]|nr:hypothetical protein [Coprobacillus sp.]